MNNENENAKMTEEDWAMSDQNFHLTQTVGSKTAGITASDGNLEDWTVDTPPVKAPEEKKKDEWEMPPPVFRVSSGTTPQKSDKIKPKTGFPANQPVILKKEAADIDIQPQPFISEELVVSEVINTQVSKAQSKTSKKVFIFVWLIAMIIFASVFLIGIYFLFFYESGV